MIILLNNKNISIDNIFDEISKVNPNINTKNRFLCLTNKNIHITNKKYKYIKTLEYCKNNNTINYISKGLKICDLLNINHIIYFDPISIDDNIINILKDIDKDCVFFVKNDINSLNFLNLDKKIVIIN